MTGATASPYNIGAAEPAALRFGLNEFGAGRALSELSRFKFPEIDRSIVGGQEERDCQSDWPEKKAQKKSAKAAPALVGQNVGAPDAEHKRQDEEQSEQFERIHHAPPAILDDKNLQLAFQANCHTGPERRGGSDLDTPCLADRPSPKILASTVEISTLTTRTS